VCWWLPAASDTAKASMESPTAISTTSIYSTGYSTNQTVAPGIGQNPLQAAPGGSGSQTAILPWKNSGFQSFGLELEFFIRLEDAVQVTSPP